MVTTDGSVMVGEPLTELLEFGMGLQPRAKRETATMLIMHTTDIKIRLDH